MLLFYSNIISARSNYVFELVFNLMGIKYQLTNDRSLFKNYPDAKINYSSMRIGDEFFIKSSSLLLENFIRKPDITIEEKFQTKILFPNDTSCDLGFDIFSAVFYMVSRYEEYLPFIPDEHGRFKAIDSLAWQNNFLQSPVVDIWIKNLKNILLEKFPSLKTTTQSFKALTTYDIDVAYKYKGRNLLRTTGSVAKDLIRFNFKNILRRAETLFNIKKDPWDVYDYLSDTISKYHLNCILFFLVGDKSDKDRNLDYKNKQMKMLLKKVKLFCKIGLHPSFFSNSFPDKFAIEKKRLESISKMKITKSRQHFLKFIMPNTYNHLSSAGITEDYSMGFPEMPGFRAGTSHPFYFFDLKNEHSTQLTLFPVTCMDVTFINYLQMTPEDTLQNMLKLATEVKKVNGTFISIWHNDSLFKESSTKNWHWVHDEVAAWLGKEIPESIIETKQIDQQK